MIFKSGVTVRLLLLAVLDLCLFILNVKGLGCELCISIWDPFCKEDILFTPYVRVFEKGRTGALLRDRGPGFIDVAGLKDIYVCTNGLVMLYYMKTTAMGEVFEHGELHWAPHHCELYNPSCNNGMPGDFPKKTLLSVLLIGHPKDYRKPALQMFIAPMYDIAYGSYINVTSLIMVGSDGECLIEKGDERARLRVRTKEPEAIKNITGEKPAIFCQLDAQRKLGQRGIITLAKPGDIGGDEPLIEKFPTREINASFVNTPYDRLGKHFHSDTGPLISPRFKASMKMNDSGELGKVADEVYTALIHDRKMRFIGCLQYPDFSAEQYRIIFNRFQESEKIKELNMSAVGEITENDDFWKDEVKPPWPVNPNDTDAATPKKRWELYGLKDVKEDSYEPYEELKAALDAAVEEYKAVKGNKSVDKETVKELENNVTTQQMMLSLWPYKKSHEGVYKYFVALKEEVEKLWDKIFKAAAGELDDHTTVKPPNFEDVENEDNKANQLAKWKLDIMRNISQAKYDRRFEPYNRILIDEYENYVKTHAKLSEKLRQKSRELGPMISNAESLNSKYRVFLNLLKKASLDLKNAVKKLEKSGKPLENFNGRHPWDTYFTDTMIEIADAASNSSEGDNATNSEGRACFDLPTRNDTCFSIRPTSERAYQLLRNRQGKGGEWNTEDLWRQKVLDLIEDIFMKVCPYISEDFAVAVNKIVKGYLIAEPLGTGLKEPIFGTRLYAHDHNYQTKVYNRTYSQTGVSNHSEGVEGKLKMMDPFWEQIQVALEDCSKRAIPMQFWHTEEGDKPIVILYRKLFRGNNTEEFYDVDELQMQEKADLEFSFNWAIDMNWRIFATVLGVCMPAYEKTIPLISARFYALYSNDFLNPLRQIWMSNRDNPVHRVILGNYYARGRADRWARICMESSFVESGDRNYRPPRNLYVNAFTEMNYFMTGPLAGTSGILSVANGI